MVKKIVVPHFWKYLLFNSEFCNKGSWLYSTCPWIVKEIFEHSISGSTAYIHVHILNQNFTYQVSHFSTYISQKNHQVAIFWQMQSQTNSSPLQVSAWCHRWDPTRKYQMLVKVQCLQCLLVGEHILSRGTVPTYDMTHYKYKTAEACKCSSLWPKSCL